MNASHLKATPVRVGFAQVAYVIESNHKGYPLYWDGEGFWVSRKEWAKQYSTLAICNQAINDLIEGVI